jgi:hypothetical protein
MIFVWPCESLVLVGLGVQVLGQTAQPVLLGEDSGGPELGAWAEGGDRFSWAQAPSFRAGLARPRYAAA